MTPLIIRKPDITPKPPTGTTDFRKDLEREEHEKHLKHIEKFIKYVYGNDLHFSHKPRYKTIPDFIAMGLKNEKQVFNKPFECKTDHQTYKYGNVVFELIGSIRNNELLNSMEIGRKIYINDPKHKAILNLTQEIIDGKVQGKLGLATIDTKELPQDLYISYLICHENEAKKTIEDGCIITKFSQIRKFLDEVYKRRSLFVTESTDPNEPNTKWRTAGALISLHEFLNNQYIKPVYQFYRKGLTINGIRYAHNPAKWKKFNSTTNIDQDHIDHIDPEFEKALNTI